MAAVRFVAIGDSFTEGVGDELHDGSVRGWADLAAQGWWVLRFSAAFVERQPGEVRRRILAAVALREAQARWAQPPRT